MLLPLVGIALLASPVVAQGDAASSLLERFEGRTSEHVFDNGWTFIIVERPVAPVVYLCHRSGCWSRSRSAWHYRFGSYVRTYGLQGDAQYR